MFPSGPGRRLIRPVLSTLRIKNLALVADLTLELRPGFCAITGETGTGKSVILGALNLVLGRRADRGALRSGAESCTVEAVFEVRGLKAPLDPFLEERGLEPCESGQLVLKRTFTAAGTNRQFVNGSPTTLATLEELGGWLIDLHGPHDHRSLLQPRLQLSLVDAYGGLESRCEAFAGFVRRLTRIREAKAALIVDERTYAQQLDLLRHQVREIADARLHPGEQAELEAEHGRVSNAARLQELSQGALALLGEAEDATLTTLGAVGRSLHDLARIDASAQPMLDLQGQAVGMLRDLQAELSRYSDRIESDPQRLAELEERLDLLQSLQRKYGGSVEEVLSFGDQARQRLESLEGRDAELERLNHELETVENELRKLGKELSDRRRAVLPGLNRAAESELSSLGFRQSRFEATLTHDPDLAQATETGMDRMEFLFAPNPGEPARPLRSIASSGELARVMLALKTVLADQDSVPVLVFDEVDANVGGETAHAVGQKMATIATGHQVLCITHLAPVAAAAATHYQVMKEVRDGRTESRIRALDPRERVAELGRMLGGGPAALSHARELLDRPSGRRS
ncbi:MAG: repair protein RecN [Verrucomicrobiota bacterium]|jgi:DNA repair protein RecN (Recombination protein N)